ncbi:ureidoglycolate lyase [Breoghania sp. L-A4]|uniref:ureidoglycolate lyase n=1 Tax=Breoghania sp. L-A4 TaxID=2304600 RepID=UPI000E35E898|nr:ureidoglycolate lyase [Breoghania sp. L-A4]AXS42179.1 hypothetical protein D1F64_21960 [Breoghania sp. L-A4]
MMPESSNTKNTSDARTLMPRRLEDSAFEPYGDIAVRSAPVPTNEGYATREDGLFSVAATTPKAGTPGGPAWPDLRLCLSTFELAPRTTPVSIAILERHPHSPQAFFPHGNARALIVVAAPHEDGSVNEATLQAFISSEGQGFAYRPGIWHAALTSLEAPATYFATQWTGTAEDCVTHKLDRPVRIEGQASCV